MKTREKFDELRNERKQISGLRFRMILSVEAVLLVAILIGFLVDLAIRTFLPNWNIPIIVEVLIVGSLVGSFATNFVSRFFFRPIDRLRQAIAQVADGDFSTTLEPNDTTFKEIKEIYAGFNLMTHELRSTEILQTDFVSSVSHEFKTPINAIEGYATLLQDIEDITDEERDQYVEKIIFNTRRLSSLVGNILLISRIDNQSIGVRTTHFRLDEQIRQSIMLLEPEWVKKEIDFDVDLCEVSINGNETLLFHVWNNLIGNAIKFNPYGGGISLRLREENDGVVFTVEDCGPGIDEDAKRHIFDKFYQADTSHKQEGNGLGLALVKQILDASGDSIKAENLEGSGCRFTVVLNKK